MANLNFQQPPRSIANASLTGRTTGGFGGSSLSGHVTPTSGMFPSGANYGQTQPQLSPNRSAQLSVGGPALTSGNRANVFNQRPYVERRMQGLGQGPMSNMGNFMQNRGGYGTTGSGGGGGGAAGGPLNNFHNVFGGSGDTTTPALLDPSEFPSLTNARGQNDQSLPQTNPLQPPGSKPYVGMVKQPTSEQSEFTMSNEDFPALPGTQNSDGTTNAGSALTDSNNLDGTDKTMNSIVANSGLGAVGSGAVGSGSSVGGVVGGGSSGQGGVGVVGGGVGGAPVSTAGGNFGSGIGGIVSSGGVSSSAPSGSGTTSGISGMGNSGSIEQQQQQQQQQQHNYIESSSGYGSLRGKAPPPTQPIYQEHYSETRTSVSPSAGQPHHLGGYNGIGNSSSSSHYQNQGAIPRQQYNGTNVGGMGPTSASLHQQQLNTASNLSELDSLLQDLSSARYNGNGYDRKDTSGPSGFHSTPSSKYNTYNSYASVEERPTVDSLLNEMDNASLYAVPNGARTKSPTPGRHVTITVRETKTENLAGPEGPVRQMEEKVVKQKDTFTPNNSAHQAYASSATKELDDLMASLSDLKVNNGSNHYHQTITDYAKPNKGTSHLTQTITETTTSTLVEDNQPDQLDSMLGSLQANMNRQGVNTVQKGCCNACEKPIVGQVITALGKTWHPEHFTCNHCNQELGTRNFFERDGFPYCEPDYHNLFSPRCAYCNGAILDKCVTALDKTWHTEHFFCAQCGQQFGEDGFHERDGKPYCRNDYFEMFAPKCNGCNRAIMENYISALNSQWHPDCFVCRDCRQPFHGGSFFDHEGLPYCETHYHAKRGSLCAGCSKPITGRCITAMFKKFHPEHFVCAFCLKQLNKGTFKEQNDKPYCHTCFEKIFG